MLTANPYHTEEYNKLKRGIESKRAPSMKNLGGRGTIRMEKDREESCYRMGGVEQVEGG